MDKLITRKEAAALLRVSKETIDRYCREGKLRRLKIGKNTRFILQDVERLVSYA